MNIKKYFVWTRNGEATSNIDKALPTPPQDPATTSPSSRRRDGGRVVRNAEAPPAETGLGNFVGGFAWYKRAAAQEPLREPWSGPMPQPARYVVGGTYLGEEFRVTLSGSDVLAYKAQVNGDPSKMKIVEYLAVRLDELRKDRQADATAPANIGVIMGYARTDFDRIFSSGAKPEDFILYEESLQAEFDKLADRQHD